MTKHLIAVVGGQFGSEAKGHVVQRVASDIRPRETMAVVRVAGPNAGHTGYDPDGRAWPLRQVPVAAVVPRRLALVIAAGSEIDPPVFFSEFDQLRDAGLLMDKTVIVDPSITLITNQHKSHESQMDLVGRIGSTGKGIGAARAERIYRVATTVRQDDYFNEECVRRGIMVAKPDYSQWQNVVIEGTQGYGLGLHTEFYPQVTSSDCRAIDFMAMAGINPWNFDQTEILVVARMYPIRVAGNSGPLKDETTWEALGLPEERTTVTKKVRRVGMPNWDLVRRAVLANGGGEGGRIRGRVFVNVALTMVDQMFPDLAGADSLETLGMNADFVDLYNHVSYATGAQVAFIATGPNSAVWNR